MRGQRLDRCKVGRGITVNTMIGLVWGGRKKLCCHRLERRGTAVSGTRRAGGSVAGGVTSPQGYKGWSRSRGAVDKDSIYGQYPDLSKVTRSWRVGGGRTSVSGSGFNTNVVCGEVGYTRYPAAESINRNAYASSRDSKRTKAVRKLRHR